MFSGLIRAQGVVAERRPLEKGERLRIEVRDLPLSVGASIAVNGACLTALNPNEQGFEADVSSETLARTTLGGLEVGSRVNLEPPVTTATPLDGHIVSGHVDAVGAVRSVTAAGEAITVWFNLDAELMRMVAEKGSIAVEGVSLTVNAVDDEGFAVMLIPHTQEVTTFAQLEVGMPVNIEVDLVARYVARWLATATPGT
ncbi:MAG: riboflavin synthase [Xanthomonadales bacterium]|jgi:riboflavin synthase|nr:riboflavin synthase [Xanthomonadales bacterium]